MSVPLNELCELIVDCPHSTAFDEGEGYPLIRTPNIGPGYFKLEGVHRVGKEAYDKRNLRAVPRAGDLILAREAPAGNVALIPEGAEYCLGQRTVLIRPNSDKVYSAYLNYYLNAPAQQHKLLKNANGATVSHVNMPVIRNLPVSLPSMNEQVRRAKVLSAYDSLIENNRKQIKLLEEAAQRLYKEWFVDLRFPGHESTPINPETNLPKGWRLGRISDLLTFINGYAFKSTAYLSRGKYRIATIKNVHDGYFDSSNMPYLDELPSNMPRSCLMNRGDILLSLTGNVGRVCLLTDDNILLNQRVAKIQSDCPSFAYCLFRNTSTRTKLEKLATGTAQKNLSPIKTSQLPLVIPDQAVLSAFELSVGYLLRQIIQFSDAIALATEARDRLLPKLMSGEIEV